MDTSVSSVQTLLYVGKIFQNTATQFQWCLDWGGDWGVNHNSEDEVHIVEYLTYHSIFHFLFFHEKIQLKALLRLYHKPISC